MNRPNHRSESLTRAGSALHRAEFSAGVPRLPRSRLLGCSIFFFFLAFLILLAFVKVNGAEPPKVWSVISDSMLPEWKVGDKYVIDVIEYEKIRKDDVLVFRTIEGRLYMHGAVRKTWRGWIVKGTNNKRWDEVYVVPVTQKLRRMEAQFLGVARRVSS